MRQAQRPPSLSARRHRFFRSRLKTSAFTRRLLARYMPLRLKPSESVLRKKLWHLAERDGGPVFRRSTRKVPAFSSSHFFTFSPEPRLFLYLRHIFNALWGLFLLKIFLEYSIIMVLYGTLLGGELWRTFYDRKKRKKDSICKCMTPTGTRR